jgi:crossover junction endodeoxyribonuclease RuvC
MVANPTRIRIVGIDPGTRHLGYGVIDRLGPARVAYVECGVISAAARLSRTERLVIIGRGLQEVCAELRPDVVAIEQPFYGKNVQATIALGEARGVALFVTAERGLTVADYSPARIKITVVGHGRATKSQVGFMVRALLGLHRTPAPDAADALAIALCHARHLNALVSKASTRASS